MSHLKTPAERLIFPHLWLPMLRFRQGRCCCEEGCKVVNCDGVGPSCLAITFWGITPAEFACGCMNRVFYLACVDDGDDTRWEQTWGLIYDHGDLGLVLQNTTVLLTVEIVLVGDDYILRCTKRAVAGLAFGITVVWELSLGETKPDCKSFDSAELAFVSYDLVGGGALCVYEDSTVTITAVDGHDCPAEECHTPYCEDCEEVESYTVNIAGVVPLDPADCASCVADYNGTWVVDREEPCGVVYSCPIITDCDGTELQLEISSSGTGHHTFMTLKIVNGMTYMVATATTHKCLVDDDTPMAVDPSSANGVCDFLGATVTISANP